MIEASRAVKLPNMALTLINFKKAQQALQAKGTIERFVSRIKVEGLDQTQLKAMIEANFARIYDFDDEEAQEGLIQLVTNNPQGFVLKPQREGGSNNYYGDEILTTLLGMSN